MGRGKCGGAPSLPGPPSWLLRLGLALDARSYVLVRLATTRQYKVAVCYPLPPSPKHPTVEHTLEAPCLLGLRGVEKSISHIGGGLLFRLQSEKPSVALGRTDADSSQSAKNNILILHVVYTYTYAVYFILMYA